MYNKCVTAFALAIARVINDAPRVMLQIVVSLTDDPRGIIYNHKVFIVIYQLATELLRQKDILYLT